MVTTMTKFDKLEDVIKDICVLFAGDNQDPYTNIGDEDVRLAIEKTLDSFGRYEGIIFEYGVNFTDDFFVTAHVSETTKLVVKIENPHPENWKWEFVLLDKIRE